MGVGNGESNGSKVQVRGRNRSDVIYVEVMKIEEITLSIVNVKYYSVVKS